MGPSNLVGGLSTDTLDKRHRISLLHYISLASKIFLGFFAVSSLLPDDPPISESVLAPGPSLLMNWVLASFLSLGPPLGSHGITSHF
ncbi:hypothetical protein FKM82_026549 [Ascaphus truei]